MNRILFLFVIVAMLLAGPTLSQASTHSYEAIVAATPSQSSPQVGPLRDCQIKDLQKKLAGQNRLSDFQIKDLQKKIAEENHNFFVDYGDNEKNYQPPSKYSGPIKVIRGLWFFSPIVAIGATFIFSSLLSKDKSLMIVGVLIVIFGLILCFVTENLGISEFEFELFEVFPCLIGSFAFFIALSWLTPKGDSSLILEEERHKRIMYSFLGYFAVDLLSLFSPDKYTIIICVAELIAVLIACCKWLKCSILRAFGVILVTTLLGLILNLLYILCVCYFLDMNFNDFFVQQ